MLALACKVPPFHESIIRVRLPQNTLVQIPPVAPGKLQCHYSPNQGHTPTNIITTIPYSSPFSPYILCSIILISTILCPCFCYESSPRWWPCCHHANVGDQRCVHRRIKQLLLLFQPHQTFHRSHQAPHSSGVWRRWRRRNTGSRVPRPSGSHLLFGHIFLPTPSAIQQSPNRGAHEAGLVYDSALRHCKPPPQRFRALPQLPATGHRRFQGPRHHQPLHQIATRRIMFLSSLDHATVHVSNRYWDTRDSGSGNWQRS